jgi:hypothetical protein
MWLSSSLPGTVLVSSSSAPVLLISAAGEALGVVVVARHGLGQLVVCARPVDLGGVGVTRLVALGFGVAGLELLFFAAVVVERILLRRGNRSPRHH